MFAVVPLPDPPVAVGVPFHHGPPTRSPGTISPVVVVPPNLSPGRYGPLAELADRLSPETTAVEFQSLWTSLPAADRPLLLRAWAELSPDALAFALQASGGNPRTPLVTDAVAALARTQPDAVTAAFMAHPSIAESHRLTAIEALTDSGHFADAEAVALGDPAAAAAYTRLRLAVEDAPDPLEWIARFDADPASRDAAAEAAVLAQRDSAGESQLLAARLAEAGWATPATLMAAVVGLDPSTALPWLDSLPVTDDTRQSAVVAAFQLLIAEDPARAMLWLKNRPASPARDSLGLELCRHLLDSDPGAARAWAAFIGDPDLRRTALDSGAE